jgi:hypothetical protein
MCEFVYRDMMLVLTTHYARCSCYSVSCMVHIHILHHRSHNILGGEGKGHTNTCTSTIAFGLWMAIA